MSQIEATKLSSYIVLGGSASEVTVPKMSIYVLLEPGEGAPPVTNGFCYAQKISRS